MPNNVSIRIFNTHIEIYPYEKGDCVELENMLSRNEMLFRNNAGKGVYKKEPFGYYILNDILYIPRGISSALLDKYFNTEPTFVRKSDKSAKITKGVPLKPPKSIIQTEAVDFLTSKNKFTYSSRYSQLGLRLVTGEGKTYAAISAILTIKERAVIVLHKAIIRDQWVNALHTMTTVDDEQVYVIKGTRSIDDILSGKVIADIYIILHMTIIRYANDHGWSKIRELFTKLKVGIKVIDEAHLHFKDTCMIDFFSNTNKTFYLTATPGRTNSKELSVFNRAFSSVLWYGDNVSEEVAEKERRKHTKLILVYFTSHSVLGYVPTLEGPKGFSIHKYIDYELTYTNGELIDVIASIIKKTETLDGKTLITTPKIDSSEYVKDAMKERFKNVDIVTINSSHNDNVNLEHKNHRYISSTLKSLGEGADIKGLRTIINAEPIGSKINAEQFFGRLREYAPDKFTYMYHIIDLAVPKSTILLNRVMSVFKKKASEIIVINYNDFM